jgi:hypothetical protein
MTWLPGRVHFVTALGHHAPGNIPAEAILHQQTYVENLALGHRVPEPGRENFRFNLWLNRDAPAGSAPIEAVVTDFAYTLPGDFNYDGTVDGADFLKWQRGESPTPHSPADLLDWQSHHGASNAPLPAGALSVPEPAAGALVLGAACLAAGQRRFAR